MQVRGALRSSTITVDGNSFVIFILLSATIPNHSSTYTEYIIATSYGISAWSHRH